MRPRALWLGGLLAVLSAMFVFPLPLAGAPKAKYADKIAEAEQFAEEDSMALARDAYAEALKLAPDAESRRWCELWLADARWRATVVPVSDWREREQWLEKYGNPLEALLTPYAQGMPQDDFWVAATGMLADLRQNSYGSDSWELRRSVADHLASQTHSAENIGRYLGYLEDLDRRADFRSSVMRSTFAEHFARAAELARDPDRRIGLLLTGLRLADETDSFGSNPYRPRSDLSSRWERTFATVRGTRWEDLVRAEHFLWRMRQTRVVDGDEAPPDFPALLDELKSHQGAVRSSEDGSGGPNVEHALAALEQLKSAWTEPALLISMLPAVRPDQPVEVSVGSANVSTLSLSLRRHSPEALVRWLRPRVLGDRDVSTGELVRAWTVAVADSGRHEWHANLLPVAPTLDPGIYSLTVGAEGASDPFDGARVFLVTSVEALQVSTGLGSTELFVYRTGTREPVAHTEATGAFRAGGTLQIWKGVTDAQGRVRLPDVDWWKTQFESTYLGALVDGQPVVLRGERNFPPVSSGKGVMDVFFDRQLFRPGETIHWKAIVREHRDGRFRVPDWGLELQVDQDDEDLGDRQEYALSSFGTAHGEFVIPKTARPGQMNFNFEATDSAGDRYGGAGLFVWVDNFVPPAIKARVTIPSGPESLRPGSEVTIRVQADYFSGGPVGGARVECHLDIDPLRGFGNNESPTDEILAWIKNVRDHPLTGVTGVDGTAEFHLALRSDLPAPATFRAEVNLVPDGGIAAWAGMQGRITKTGFIVAEEEGGPSFVAPGELRRFSWQVTDGFGEPTAFRGEVRLIEVCWVEAWLDSNENIVTGADVIAAQMRSFVSGRLEPPGNWRKLQSGYVASVVATQPVDAKSDGAITASFVLPRAGLYRTEIVRDRDVVAPMKPEWGDLPRVVWAVANEMDELGFDPRRTAIVPTKPWRQGAPLRLLVVLPEGRSAGVLALAGGDAVQTTRVDLGGRRMGFVTVDQPPVAAGELIATLGVFEGEDRRELEPVRIPAIDCAAPLEIELVPNEETARPGAQSRLVALIRDAEGHPVRAELALTATDEAVNQLWSADVDEVSEFVTYRRAESVGFEVSARNFADDLRPLNDIRLGTPQSDQRDSSVQMLLEDFVEQGRVYAPSSTLAGSVIHAPLRDVSNAVDVVTEQFVREIRGNGADDLLIDATNEDEGAQDLKDTDSTLVVRQHFSSTAFWAPEVVTNDDGEAQVEFTYPDNLTKWRVAAYAVGKDGESFQRSHTFTHTSLPLQARLHVPRVLVAGDTSEATASLVNRIDEALSASAQLFLRGPVVPVDADGLRSDSVSVPAQSETHLNWTIRASDAGVAAVAIAGRSGAEGDAMIVRVPVLEDGVMQESAASGRLAVGDRRKRLKLELPRTLDRASSEVTVQLTANHAAALLDALPYLIDYPHGCVEQTMNRFVPAVIVKQALVNFGQNAEAIEQRVRVGASTHGARNDDESKLSDLDDVIAQSFTRLAGARMKAQGYGWWPGAKTPDLWMTAYVAWGLALARETGIEVPYDLSPDVEADLMRLLGESESGDDRMAWALAAAARCLLEDDEDRSVFKETLDRVYVSREKLSAAGRASLALAAVKFGDDEQREILLRNLENGARRVKSGNLGDTVHWGATGNYWRAMDGAVESTALTLLALLELAPDHALVEPAVNWLVLNRRSAHWASTRDTAFAILALTKYLSLRGELDADAEVDVFANGKKVQRVKFTRESLLAGDTVIVIDPKLLRGGNNTIELRRVSGKSPVYAVALASSWARGDAVKPAGHLINVARGFVRQKQEPTLLGTLRITPEPLPADGKANAAVTGEQVTARVTLNVPNELEYVMVEVPKPAGCEPLNPLSGYDARLRWVGGGRSVAGLGEAGRSGFTDPGYKRNDPAAARPSISDENVGRPIYREEHDDKSVFFIDSLAAGTWEIVFSLRATTPGDFRALPVQASAMYVPEVRANSVAQRVRIERRVDHD